MNVKIIKDCRPYFLILEHDQQFDLMSYASRVIEQNNYNWSRKILGFSNHRIASDDLHQIYELSLIKMFSQSFSEIFASIYVTEPGMNYPIHTDGNSKHPINWSINYIITAKDDKCKTKWYSDDSVSGLKKIETTGNILIKSQDNITEIHSEVFAEGQCILFNTAMFHSFDNSDSDNIRRVLTIRKIFNQLPFDDIATRVLSVRY
jgi:hypothetical protein